MYISQRAKKLRRKPERILCPAIWYDDGHSNQGLGQPRNIHTGYVVGGYRHGNILLALNRLGKKGTRRLFQIQGFLTTWNRFLGRRDARLLFLKRGGHPANDCELFSEDLY